MRKSIIFLLLMVLLAGCSAAQVSPSQSAAQSPTSAPSPAGSPEVTAEPSPIVEDAIDAESFREQGYEAILGIIPAENRLDIPQSELAGADASLTDKSCNVGIQWVTGIPIKDAAVMLSDKLQYELVKSESDNDWRNPEGAEYDISIRLKESESGLSITYIMPLEMAQGTILTDGFPMDSFSELPEELDPADAANSSVYYDDTRSVWRYQLGWNFEQQAGTITDKLSSLYDSKDGFKKTEGDDKVSVEYSISSNEKMMIGWRTGDEYSIDAVYEYAMPGHLESTLMQTLLGSDPGILAGDLPEECFGILYEANGASITYYEMDKRICYSMMGPDSDSHPFAQKAQLLTGAPLTQNEHGGYNFNGDGYSLTLKFSQGNATWEYETDAPEGFSHPYIQDIYPAEYEPELPEALKNKPYSMSTRYWAGGGTELEMERTYVIEDKKAAEKAIEALKETLTDYPGFEFGSKDGRTSINCMIKEYGFSCVLEQKDERLLLKIAFRYTKQG